MSSLCSQAEKDAVSTAIAHQMQRCTAGSLSCAAIVGWAHVIVTSCFVAWVSDLGNTWLTAAAWFRRTEKIEPDPTSVPRKSAAIAVTQGGLIENEWEICVFTAVPDLVRAQTRSVSQNIRTILLYSVGFMLHTSKKKPRGNFLKGEALSKKKKKEKVRRQLDELDSVTLSLIALLQFEWSW